MTFLGQTGWVDMCLVRTLPGVACRCAPPLLLAVPDGGSATAAACAPTHRREPLGPALPMRGWLPGQGIAAVATLTLDSARLTPELLQATRLCETSAARISKDHIKSNSSYATTHWRK